MSTQLAQRGPGGQTSAGPAPSSWQRLVDGVTSNKRLTAWLLLVPALGLMAAVLGYPLLEVVVRSFTDPTVGLDNYRWFFTTDINIALLVRTFMTAALVTLACVVLGVPYVFFMTVASRRTTVIMLLLIMVPFWTSTIVRNFAWVVLLQEQGFVNEVLTTAGLPKMTLIRTTAGVIVAMSQVLIPFMVLPLFGTMSKIDLRLVQAAKSLGARPVVAFWKVYFPLARPGILAGAILVFVLSLGFYITPAMVGSNKNTLISGEIYLQINEQLAWGHGAAMGVVLLVVTLAILAAGALLFKAKSPLQGGSR
ncbi:ABC transporter permease [Aeromicrobium sp. JJY06]|uniref:ABC transporter permease n=1 Tax=Aeromicrobium sp. JJY06 TaxID=3373478 RepID=UPI00376EDDDC